MGTGGRCHSVVSGATYLVLVHGSDATRTLSAIFEFLPRRGFKHSRPAISNVSVSAQTDLMMNASFFLLLSLFPSEEPTELPSCQSTVLRNVYPTLQ
ncbi:hypothetical protein LZ31DRAFT_211779 [Colletotrichum somersetense]|nr:hypothetical protein LZ31DRAFT_211779 [Colletotrichum somersetense]